MDKISSNKTNTDLRYINGIYVILFIFYGINFISGNYKINELFMKILIVLFPLGILLNSLWRRIVKNEISLYYVQMCQLTLVIIINDWFYAGLSTNSSFVYVPIILCIMFLDWKLFKCFVFLLFIYQIIESLYVGIKLDILLMTLSSDTVFVIILMYIFSKFNRSKNISNYHKSLLSKAIKKNSYFSSNMNKLLSALEYNPNSVVITDTKGNIEYINRKFTELTGYDYDEVVGMNASILSSGIHEKEFYKELWSTINNGETWTGEFINKKKDGDIYYESAKISPVYDDKNRLVSFVSTKNDITYEKELTETLENFAKYDHLTGIYNRRIGFEMLNNLIEMSYMRGFKVSVVYIDLDGLKIVNDKFGHTHGDSLLKGTVNVLNEFVRESDIFYRYGGDEFVIVFSNSSSESVIKLMEIANKKLEESFSTYGSPVRFSYGVYTYDGKDKLDAGYILDKADRKMYENKIKVKEIRDCNE